MRRGTPPALLTLLIALTGCTDPAGERSATTSPTTSPTASPTPTLEAMPGNVGQLAWSCDPEEAKAYDAPAYKGKGPHRLAVVLRGYYDGGHEQTWRLTSVDKSGFATKEERFEKDPKLVACVQRTDDRPGDTALKCSYGLGNDRTATVTYQKATYSITVHELRTRRVVRRFDKVAGNDPARCPVFNDVPAGRSAVIRFRVISEDAYARLLRPLINATP